MKSTRGTTSRGGCETMASWKLETMAHVVEAVSN